jgi:hypothetical protein
MLYSIDKGAYIYSSPHQEEYALWMRSLRQPDYERICAELDRTFDAKEVNVSSLIPDSWIGTVWEPIRNAFPGNSIKSSCFFGLIVFYFLRDHRKDVWGIDSFHRADWQPETTIYYRLDNPPPVAASA